MAFDRDAYLDRIGIDEPVAPTETGLEAIHRGLTMPLEDGLAFEATLFGVLCASEDMKEGTRAFLEKRKPQFKGR